ncbi:MAG: insulinase family protein [Chromatiaceae bacterium]|nr:insulinase family protein [Chromatiaceae bacterium]
MRGRSLALLLCLFPLAALGASTVQQEVLDNGLKVLVKPDQRAPVVTVQVWYRVGSGDEHEGLTGLSHMLEHMMFKGTETLAPGDYSRIIAANGGEENAFTSRDYTAYYQNLASDRLDIAFELEADRMRHLKLAPEEFAPELQVVREERRMRTEDNPRSLTYERFNAAAFEVSPYRHPVIGWASDIEQYRIEDLRSWYRQWYAPNNATLVVAGDVQPEEVFRLAERHFGPLESETIEPIKARPEPEQLGEKRIQVKAPAQEPWLVMGYKTPVLATAKPGAEWEPYALEMLAAVLDGGSSARFSRELVRSRQIAASAGAGYSAFSRRSELFLLEGVPARGQDIATLEAALREQIERVRTEPVQPEELERIRTQLIAGKVYEQDSLFYQAMQLGMLETVGLGWELADTYVERISAVTPEQIQAVARNYLVSDHLTVAVLDPQPTESVATPSTSLGDSGHVH